MVEGFGVLVCRAAKAEEAGLIQGLYRILASEGCVEGAARG